MIAGADLHMGGYEGDRIPHMQRRMIDAISTIPGVSAAGYITRPPLSVGAGDSFVYTDTTTDFRPTNNAADAMTYSISAGYIQAAGTRLLAGRDLAFSDDRRPCQPRLRQQGLRVHPEGCRRSFQILGWQAR